MRDYAKAAPTHAMRDMFEAIAAEYEKPSAREDNIIRQKGGPHAQEAFISRRRRMRPATGDTFLCRNQRTSRVS